MDVATASDGRFGPDPMSAFDDWDAFREWAADVSDPGVTLLTSELGPPVPRPPQVFAIGVNYREHADEAGYPPDSLPVTFTKFPSSLTGPDATVTLPDGNVDWEVELVVAISRGGHSIPREEAWNHIAGLTVGQDLSERLAQLEGTRPQFSLAKSHPGFSPTGPWLVSVDEFADPADLAISCSLDGEVLQDSRTSRMIYDVPELVARLSAVVSLLPGDLIFTGTPSGIGNARTPKRFLQPGEVLTSTIEGVGEIITRFA
ncbi:fumarylacetoacetate hydrolase family protein [Microbacterium sp. NPDC019599]|uniref:fumarylacetoacetate hydrolase family protein n=1 Tax=Microbacterium sp. NPDC019599 TaxID=3154690 RepID=UPI00340D80E2